MYSGKIKKINDVQIGDSILDAYGEKQTVLNKFIYEVDEELVKIEFENGIIVKCTKEHEFLINFLLQVSTSLYCPNYK